MLKVSVVVLAQGPDNKPVSEVTQTVTVNAHGAKVLMRVKVSIGQLLTLRHSGTEEQVLCRVAYVSPSIRKARSGARFYEALPRVLAHCLPSARLDNAKSRSKKQGRP